MLRLHRALHKTRAAQSYAFFFQYKQQQRFTNSNSFKEELTENAQLHTEEEAMQKEDFFKAKKQQFMEEQYVPLNMAANRKSIFKFYRRIVRLLLALNHVQQVNQSDSVSMATKMVKQEFRRNFDLTDQMEIDACFEEAEKYVQRLKIKHKAQLHVESVAPKQTQNDEDTADEDIDEAQYLKESAQKLEQYWNYYFQQVCNCRSVFIFASGRCHFRVVLQFPNH